MGQAIELITVQATAPGAGAAFAAVPGNSLIVRDSQKPTWLGPVWSKRQALGFQRFTSPLMHDSTVGIQTQSGVGVELVARRAFQRLYAQDTMTVFGSGSAVAGDIEQVGMLWAYEDLPGVEGRFIDVADLARRGEDVYSWQNSITTVAGGGYTGSELINSEQDQLKANRDYAIVGYSLTGAAAAIRYVGVDWGNLGVGGPGPAILAPGARFDTNSWFMDVSGWVGMSAIPVFNSANKSLTFVSAAQDENAVAVILTTFAVLLSPKGKK